MSHLVLLWQGISTFIAGFLAGVSLVCVGSWLLVAWFIVRRREPRGGGWQAGPRSTSSAHEVTWPITLQELPKHPLSSPSAPQEETCNWLNTILNYFLFPSTPMNGLQRRIRAGLLDRLLGVRRETGGFISCLTVEEVRGSKRSPNITKITALKDGQGDEEELHLALDVSFRGDASILVSGILGLGLGKVSASLRLRPSSGRLLLKFTRLPSPRISLMFSDLPNFTLTVDRGESSLGRVANLASLILSSLLRNHAIFPHFQSLLLKPEAETFDASLTAPFWRSSRRFLRVQVQSVTLSEEMAAASHGAAIIVSVSVGGVSKCKSGPLFVDQQTFTVQSPRLILQHALSPSASPSRDLILVTVTRKGGSASGNSRFVSQKKTILFTASLPLDCIPTDVPHTMGIFPEPGRAAGCRVNLELLSCTESMSVSRDPTNEWPLARGLQLRPGEDVKYLNGLDWSNFKRAWRRFRKKSDALEQEQIYEYDNGSMCALQRQLEELIQSLAETGKALPAAEQTSLRNSLSSLSSELSTIMSPTPGVERLEEISEEIKSLQRSYSRLHGENCCSLEAARSGTPQLPDPPFSTIDDSFELLSKPGEEVIHLDYKHERVKYHLYSAPDSLAVKMEAESTSLELPEVVKIPILLANEAEKVPCDMLLYPEEGVFCILAGGRNVMLTRSTGCVDSLYIIETHSSATGMLTITMSCIAPHRSCTFILSLPSAMTLIAYFNRLASSLEWSIDPRGDTVRSSSLTTSKDAHTLSGLIYVEPKEISKGSLLIPIIGIPKHQLDLILARTSLTALTPRLVNPQSVSSAREPFHGELFGAFGLYLRPEYVSCVAKAFLKRSLPLPGYLFLTSLGIFFSSKISEKRLLLPKSTIQSCELHTKWHTKFLSIAVSEGGSRVTEFMQITDAFITSLQDWCVLHQIPLHRDGKTIE